MVHVCVCISLGVCVVRECMHVFLLVCVCVYVCMLTVSGLGMNQLRLYLCQRRQIKTTQLLMSLLFLYPKIVAQFFLCAGHKPGQD